MASLAPMITPSALLPICMLLELVASSLMVRGGFAQANMRVVWGLAIAGAVGIPIGLSITASVSPDVSRILALALILVLALLQLFRQSPAFLATNPGLYLSGLTAGIANGIASVGGMVVALYVLSQKTSAAKMRGTLVMYLFINLFFWGGWLVLSGAPVTLIGVWLGSKLFKPTMETTYKRFCLFLLIGLALSGLFRLTTSG